MMMNKYGFGAMVGEAQIALDEAQRHKEAVASAQQIAKTSSPPCPISVEPACRQTEQDALEKEHNIAPGCGYYRRRHDEFLKRFPDRTAPKYYLEYGEKYCNRFTRETYNKLSPEGKKWFDGVKCGLQEGIESIVNDPDERYKELLDREFTKEAFDMHAPVYLKNGLKDLHFYWDQWHIGCTPIEEFNPFSKNFSHTIKQVIDVTPEVLEGWGERTAPDIEDWLENDEWFRAF